MTHPPFPPSSLRIAPALLLALALLVCPAASQAAEPELEASTLHSLGVHWVVPAAGPDAAVHLEWHPSADATWHDGGNLFRVEPGAHRDENGHSSLDVPANATLFAGSVLTLEENRDYELRLTLRGAVAGPPKILKARTATEPSTPPDAVTKHVIPGTGGGTGTAADPFQGLAAAQATARPGDRFLLHKGTYPGTFEITKNGEPDKPIVWSGAGDGEAIIDAQAGASKLPGQAVAASDRHDLRFERLTICHAQWGVVGNESSRIVVRRCHIHGVEYGITGTRNDRRSVRGWFIADNTIEGPSVWPRSKGIENARGIQITGEGHDICYNRIRGFADAIDTFPSPVCAGIDFHHNEISEMTDDGCEMDYSERNTRCFLNRFTNVFQGISVQPVFGGPVYIFRNALYNVVAEPFKMHNSPSGALFYHNTCVKRGMPFFVSTEEPVHHCITRNNLFTGTEANYALEMSPPAKSCDFDCDGFAGGPWKLFLKWNGERYNTLADTRAKAPVYRHAITLDASSLFASGVLPPADEKKPQPASDLRLKPGSAAIDAGEILPGINDGFTGKAPDLGAYEAGTELPHYGPRPDTRP